jgi:hypothetical protein
MHCNIAKLATLSLAVILALAAAPAQAKDAAEVNESIREDPGPQAFSAYLENDTFTDTDKYYTNAVKLSWLSSDLLAYEDNATLKPWVTDLISKLQFIQDREDPDLRYNIGFSIGQNIYTPEDTDTEELVDDDRPYAAWLYGALALHAKTRRVLDTIELSLGVIGPIAQGENSQNNVHDFINEDRANGWDNQLEDEPGIMLTWLRTTRLRPDPPKGFGWDLMYRYGATLGNVMTFANAGGEARLGYNPPADFGTSRIRPGGSIAAPGKQPGKDDFGVYLFTDVDARLIGRNIFLDGNTFTDSHRVDKKYVVADLSAGASIYYGPFRLTYSYVYRTDEFDGQEGTGQFFGSIGFTYLY